MLKNIKTFILNNIHPLLLLSLSLLISALTYKKGTFLIGFDSLHNEFNLLLNIRRNFFGVWQTHQGLGLLGGMSHLSDIPRMLILFLLSLFFPVSFLRYAWTFLMLTVGPLGMYFFSLKLIQRDEGDFNKPAAFLAGLFYLFNLSTVQLFYSNFDGFVTHYGFIPWLFLTSYLFLTNGNKKHLLYFLILSILSANQAYTGTLFFAFALFLSIFLFMLFFQNREIIPVKRLLKTIIFWVGINLFWILPVGYFIATSSDVVSKASINLMSSEESYFMNKKYGNIGDVLTLKSFWFDLNDYDSNKEDFIPLLNTWKSYLEGKVIILYIFSSFVVLGFIIAILKKEYRPMALLFLVSVFFLMAGNGFLGIVFLFFQKHVPLFKEALRFPFTKFSVLASFTYSFLIAVFFNKILNLGKKLSKNDRYLKIIPILFILLLSYVFYPYFNGKLINPRMKVSVPNEYFEIYDFFSNRPVDERVYLMPSNTFWAWEYYNWGYRGSGFVWYGMKQSVLTRAFDVWNSTNEKVYWEISYAFSSREPKILNAVLNKYKIKWLLFDGSRVYPNNDYMNNYSIETKKYLDSLESTGEIILRSYDFGFLTAYETTVEASVVQYSGLELPNVLTYQNLSSYDPAYVSIGDYLSDEENNVDILYPYSYLSGVRSVPLNSDAGNLSPLYKPDSGIFSFYGSTVPLVVSLQASSENVKVVLDKEVTLKNNILIEEEVILKDSDSIVFLNSHYEAGELFDKEKQGLLTPDGSPIYLRIYRTKTVSPLNNLITYRPQISTCSQEESGSYSIEYRENSYYLESTTDNQSVCLYTGLVIKPDNRYLRVLNLNYNSENMIGRVCFLDKELNTCVYSQNFFQPGDYSVPLLNLREGKDYLIYFYSYPSSEVSQFLNSYSSEFSNLYIEDKELIFEEKTIVPDNIIGTDIDNLNINLQNFENKTYLYENDDLVRLFRSCKEGLGEMGFVNEKGVLTFLIPSEESLCLTVVTDSMLPFLPFSGVVEIEYEVSDKGQNVYVIKDNLLVALDRFEKLKPSGKLNFPVFNVNSLSLNVELTSPGSEGNFLKIKSVKVIPFDIKGVLNSEIYVNQSDRKISHPKVLEYKGTNYLYKIKDAGKGMIFFNQSYSKDWVLMCSNLKCHPTHYEMSGWGNAWNIEEPSKFIYIVYIPQILGFIGFFISILTLIFGFFTLKKRDNF